MPIRCTNLGDGCFTVVLNGHVISAPHGHWEGHLPEHWSREEIEILIKQTQAAMRFSKRIRFHGSPEEATHEQGV